MFMTDQLYCAHESSRFQSTIFTENQKAAWMPGADDQITTGPLWQRNAGAFIPNPRDYL
jgi:hypothetical protein